MTSPNMATITASLERSLQNCSLNQEINRNRTVGGGGEEGLICRLSTSADNNLQNTVSDTGLDLNSHLSLPYHWEQCLDPKTGEIYYINWRNGMKAKEDPRKNEYFYSKEEDDRSDDSEESSSESSSSRDQRVNYYSDYKKNKDNVLVVAGCKSCFMYFMVPKQVKDCPKCNGQLLHFDRSENSSP